MGQMEVKGVIGQGYLTGPVDTVNITYYKGGFLLVIK